MYEFKRGDRVRIHTKTHGCYDDITGTVINKMTNDIKAVLYDKSGFLAYHMSAEGWFRVLFDNPVPVFEYMFDRDIFDPTELTIEEV